MSSSEPIVYQQLFTLKDTRTVVYHAAIKKIEVIPFVLA